MQCATGISTTTASMVDSSSRMTYKGLENLNRTVKPKFSNTKVAAGQQQQQDLMQQHMAQLNHYGAAASLPLNERDSWKSATNTIMQHN